EATSHDEEVGRCARVRHGVLPARTQVPPRRLQAVSSRWDVQPPGRHTRFGSAPVQHRASPNVVLGSPKRFSSETSRLLWGGSSPYFTQRPVRRPPPARRNGMFFLLWLAGSD